jgi:uncharacterized membrane protein (DUF373 family)
LNVRTCCAEERVKPATCRRNRASCESAAQRAPPRIDKVDILVLAHSAQTTTVREGSMPSPRRSPGQLLQETREHWSLMNHYERFEHVVAFILSVIIALVIALALLQLLTRVVPLLVTGAIDPLDHEVFQGLFGMIMTLLIALEFKHSIIRVALRRESIVQVKTVVLIALLALSRKFIVLDSKVTEAQTIAALALATLVLGIVYWLLRERDDRLPKDRRTGPGAGPGGE